MPSSTEKQPSLFADAVPDMADNQDRSEPSTRVFQDLILDEATWAVKRAEGHETIHSLYEDLTANLPQNSAATRQRYTQSILEWFFGDDTPRCFATRVWTAYRNDVLLNEIVRFQYLQNEPVMGDSDP